MAIKQAAQQMIAIFVEAYLVFGDLAGLDEPLWNAVVLGSFRNSAGAEMVQAGIPGMRPYRGF